MPTPYPTRGVVTAATLSNLYADSEVFPALPGQDWVVGKAPTWSTIVRRAASGNEVRGQWFTAPLYDFKVQYPVIRDRPASSLLPLGSELQQLIAFFNYRRGKYGFFYYYDPSANAVTNETSATGDGTTTTFQLTRTVGKGTPYATQEPVYALWNNPTSLTVGGVAKTAGTDYTINTWGTITFTSAPANGAAIVWSGNFLFVCRFDQDKLEFKQLVKDLWEQTGLAFVSLAP